MTENKYKIVSSNVEEGIYTQIRKDGKNAFTLKEAMEYVEEHEQSARETNTELEIVPLPNCLYVEDETTKTFLTNGYGIDFDKRADYVIKEHPHLNIKWQAAPLFYYDGFECNIVDNEAPLMYYNKHQINEVGCDKEIKFMDLDEFLNSNPNVNNPVETIVDFIKKHTADGETDVKLKSYTEKYLIEEDSKLFDRLTRCTVGSKVSVGFDMDGDAVVYDSNGKCFAGYSKDFPVTAVYLDLSRKMQMLVRLRIKEVKEQFTKDKEFKVCKGDYKNYNSIMYFGSNYGIVFKGIVENHTPYVKIIGINE